MDASIGRARYLMFKTCQEILVTGIHYEQVYLLSATRQHVHVNQHLLQYAEAKRLQEQK